MMMRTPKSAPGNTPSEILVAVSRKFTFALQIARLGYQVAKTIKLIKVAMKQKQFEEIQN